MGRSAWGAHTGGPQAHSPKYFYCWNREPKRRGVVRTGCLGQTNVIKRDPNLPLWTVEVVHAHTADCANADKIHGIPTEERNRLTTTYTKPSAAQTDRTEGLAELAQLRCVFQYVSKKDSKLLDLSPEAIRQTLIAENRKNFKSPNDEAWLETLVVRVEKWKANGAQERVILITTAALLRLAEQYEVGGVDATYKVSPRQSCVMVFGVYHERAFLPIALGISSSRTAGVLPKKGFGSKGETEEHYARFLAFVKELCPGFRPRYFVRDAARQIHNAIEALWAGVHQCTCWFHVEQCIEQWFASPAAYHLRSAAAEMKRYLVAIHYAKVGDADRGLELLRRDWPLEEFWHYMSNANRMPGQVQANWTRESFEAGAPVTAGGLEHMNSILKTYFKEKRVSAIACGAGLAHFVFDTDTKTSRLNRHGIPRQLESYYIDRRAETLLSWTRGLALVAIVHSTLHFEHDGVTHWATHKGGHPISCAKAQELQHAAGDSFAAWLAWQDVRVFTCNACTCPWHQKTAFCKHVAAARAVTEGARAPPSEVISSREWSHKVFDVLRVHRLPSHVAPSSLHVVAHLAGQMMVARHKRGRSQVAGRDAPTNLQARPPRSPSCGSLRQPPRSVSPASSVQPPARQDSPRPNNTSESPSHSTTSLRGPPADDVPSTASDMVRAIKTRTRSLSQGIHNK